MARVLSVPGLWVLMTLAGALIGPTSTPINLPDLFWTLEGGAWMAEHGRVLDFDPFNSAPHVPGPVLNVQWLADVLYHALEVAGGLDLVIVGTALVICVSYALVLAAAISVSGRVRTSCVAVGLAYAVGATNLSPRPQTLVYPLFALFVLAVVRSEWHGDRRLLWLLPIASVLWANLHGSFFLGWLLLGCALMRPLLPLVLVRVEPRPAWRAARPYGLTLLGCVVACMVTPYGPGSIVYVVRLTTNPIVRDLVTEWAPTSVAVPEGVLLWASIGLLGALVLTSGVRLSVFEMLMLLGFGVLAVSSVRAVVWWGLVIAPVLARALGNLLPRRLSPVRERPRLNALIALGILGIVGLSLPWTKAVLPILPAYKRGLLNARYAPEGAAAYLRAHDPPAWGRMLNEETWGGYLDWAAWPRHQPFVDGRIEVHPAQVWLDYLEMTFPTPRWRALLDEYAISYAVLSPTETPDLVSDLRQDPAWHIDYEDDQAVIFERPAPLD